MIHHLQVGCLLETAELCNGGLRLLSVVTPVSMRDLAMHWPDDAPRPLFNWVPPLSRSSVMLRPASRACMVCEPGHATSGSMLLRTSITSAASIAASRLPARFLGALPCWALPC
jgi:hypothetical protein